MIILESLHWNLKFGHILNLVKYSAIKMIVGVGMFSREVKVMMNLTFRGQGQFSVQLLVL